MKIVGVSRQNTIEKAYESIILETYPEIRLELQIKRTYDVPGKKKKLIKYD